MINEDEDPTIITNILEEFRANANNYYRSSMLPINVAHDKSSSALAKARRLKFEDSTSSTSDVPDKKLKLTTPQSREASKSSNVMSPWEIRLLKSDAIKFKSQVIEAEERIKKLEGLKLETELHYAREKKVMEDSLSQERNRVTELENRIAFIRKREAEAIEKYTQLKLCENNKESNLRQVIIDLQKENQNLKEQVYELNEDIENRKKQENNEINSYKSELSSMKSQEEMHNQLIETLRNELSEKNNELRKLEVEQTKLLSATKRVKDLEMELERFKETRVYVEMQNKKLLRYSDLEKEVAELKETNKRIKSSMSDTLYLEEIVEDLKTRQKTLPNLEQEIFKLRNENQNSRIDLENWTNLAKHYCAEDLENVKPYILVKRRLEELVRKELWYSSENKNLEIEVNHLKEEVAEKNNEITKLKEQVETFKSSCETHAANIRRLKKQLILISWERNDLRKLVDSCQKDMTINPEINSQFEALQKLIDGYKERAAQFENDAILAFSGVGTKQPTAEIEEFQKKEALLKEENKKLSEKVQYLSDQLEYRNLKGDFDPRQTKILHLKSNPASEAVQNYEDRLSKANEEVIKLRERIKVMEEGNNADVTRIVEERVQTNSLKEINDLKEQAKSLEIQNRRLLEVFKKRTHDFRDAMYMLFGYKIDVLGTNQYRLCNQYSYDSQDILLFQISDGGNGTMELLETSFSQTLTELIDLHLKQHKSIPLFLSSLTVDLFNKQTLTSFSTTEAIICD